MSSTKDAVTGLPQVKVEGPTGASGTIEVSTRVSGGTWSALTPFTLGSAPYSFLDRNAAGKGPRFYRVKSSGVNPAVLPDLALSANQVFVAGEGFDTIQFAPNGNLGLIFWRNRDLVLRERSADGWTEQVIASDGNLFDPTSVLKYNNFQPAAVLLYDSGSNPHIFRVANATVSHYVRNGASWTRSESLTPSNGDSITKLVGGIGANNVLHLGVLGSSGNIVYGTPRSGAWQWSTVAQAGSDPYWTPGSYARRWFSMAIDSRNSAHFAFRPSFTMNAPNGYPLAYTQLWYASNRSGNWTTSLVRQPDDDSGEVGSGQSIAIGPDDQPCIASWYNERGPGGSSLWSRLQYYQLTAAGAWNRSEVLSRPEAYISGDGEKGTGAQPYLRFDEHGRPHIFFLDHAGEHFPFQNEYAGHIRHAWWNGSQWAVESVYRQDKPLQQQILFPAFAMRGNELAAGGLERLTQWVTTVNPQIAASTYKYQFLTKPLL